MKVQPSSLLIGYSLVYNSLDSMTAPTSGIYGKFSQEFAGVGW